MKKSVNFNQRDKKAYTNFDTHNLYNIINLVISIFLIFFFFNNLRKFQNPIVKVCC